MPRKVVLAYSGGLDTSAILVWLKDTYDCEVVCYCGDVGQGDEELEGVEQRALAAGASACHILDLRREFIEDFVFPTMMAGAVYEGRYLLGTSIARPILARAQVEVARAAGADAVCHGCTGKGNDQVRFESAFAALAPDLEVIAPWRLWNFKGRSDLRAYLESRGVKTASSATKAYSRDRNLLHISHEGGALEDPWNPPPEDAWVLTRAISETPDAPLDVTLEFENGRPVSLDGRAMPGHELVSHLNSAAGQHGVGRIDLIENRVVGMKSRGLYETPGGTVVFEAMRGLEELVLDRATRRYRDELGLHVAHLVYEGRWFTPLREALMSAATSIAHALTGEVVVRLHKGHATTVQRRSPNSLYSDAFATFEKDAVYDQRHAEGFIRLFSLPDRIRASAAQPAAANA
ncbi:MAG: argininosuccinate synthase [Phycisphaeraceae bacterium]|nr:argininosuccinate synthase [Phycisphaeraceae bacterium]